MPTQPCRRSRSLLPAWLPMPLQHLPLLPPLSLDLRPLSPLLPDPPALPLTAPRKGILTDAWLRGPARRGHTLTRKGRPVQRERSCRGTSLQEPLVPVLDAQAPGPSPPPACSPFILCNKSSFHAPCAGPLLLTNWGMGKGAGLARWQRRSSPSLVVGLGPLASEFRHPVPSHGFWD